MYVFALGEFLVMLCTVLGCENGQRDKSESDGHS